MTTPTDSALGQLRDSETWRRKLGLLPIPLQAGEHTFVMLNGGRGNFCLDPTGERQDGRSLAWSADVGHFVSISDNFVVVSSWNRESWKSREIYRPTEVVEQLSDFHRALEANEPNRDQSIVAHALRVLGQLRALLPPDVSAVSAIQHFIMLLGWSLDDADPRQETSRTAMLSSDIEPWKNHIRDEDWQMLRAELTYDRPVTALRPHVDLMLRHASGALFQESHYRIVQPITWSLPGFPVAPPRTTRHKDVKASGVFFTPSALARTLVEEALNALGTLPSELTVHDPACGSGEFLKELLRQLELRDYRGVVELYGWDILPAPMLMCRFSLDFEQRSARRFGVRTHIECKNSLIALDWPDAHLILMNPPFMSWQLMDDVTKEIVRQEVGDEGRPNLAAAFVTKAAKHVRKGGVLGAILPSSIADAHSSAGTRGRLADEFTPYLIAKLGSQAVFSNATVDAGLYVGCRDKIGITAPARIVWADHQTASISQALRTLRAVSSAGLMQTVVDEDTFSIYPDSEVGRTSDAWTVAPYRQNRLFARMQGLPTLGNLFEIKQGIRLGSDVFVVPHTFVQGLAPAERRFFRPAVVNASLRCSRLNRDHWVWYPETPGLPQLRTEDDVSKNAPEYYKLLLGEKSKLERRKGMEGKNWWDLVRARNWQRAAEAKLVTTYFGDSGSVGFDERGDFVVVVGHAWVPKAHKKKHFNAAIAYAYVAIGASDLFSKLLHATSVHVGGGQVNLENRHIARLPMVNLFDDAAISPILIHRLSEHGQALCLGKSPEHSLMDRTVCEVFGLL